MLEKEKKSDISTDKAKEKELQCELSLFS